MSYLKDLDEYTDRQIVSEYRRRVKLGLKCYCTYCEKPKWDCECKMKRESGMFAGVGDDGSVKYYD